MTPKLQGRGAGYRAANYLYHNHTAPISRLDLFLAVDFGAKLTTRADTINRAFNAGWLVDTGNGKVDISPAARATFEAPEKPAAKYQGIAATTREPLIPLYERQPLSAKYKTNSRGNRDDVPAFSVRAEVSFRTLAGGI
jgi:hypothetical protein